MRAIAIIILSALIGALTARMGHDQHASKATIDHNIAPKSSQEQLAAPSLLQLLAKWRVPESIEAFQLAWTKQSDRVLKRLLISEWVAFDAPSALEHALTLTGEDRRLFLAEIFLTNAELGLRHLRDIAGSNHSYWVNETVKAWLAQASEGKPTEMTRLSKLYQLDNLDPAIAILADPASALAKAHTIEDSEAREDRIAEICETWYRLDPLAAWKYAKEHLSSRTWQSASFEMFDDWMRKDTRTAFTFRQDLPMLDPSYWYERLGSLWGEGEDFSETVEAVKDTPKGSLTRSTFVAGLVFGKTIASSDQGFALLPHLPNDGQHQNGRLSLLGKIRDLLVEEQDTSAAAAWMAQLDDPYERLWLQQNFAEATIDHSEFIALFAKETDPDKIFGALGQLARQSTFDAKTLDSLLASIPVEHQPQAYRRALEHMPPHEAFLFGEQRGGELWQDERSDVLTRWSEVNPQGVLEVLSPDEKSAQWTMESWYKNHPSDVDTWVDEQSDSQWQSVRESVLAEVNADQIKASLYRGDVTSWPDLADQAASIHSSLFSTVIQRWARVDPQEAQTFLSNPDNHAQMNPRHLKNIDERQRFVDAVMKLRNY